MKLLRILPWKRVTRRLTRRHGFVDPIELFDRMRQFAQPSEVGEPIELLRAGAAFHARGLINRTVQFNLDWVWPYWIERQFDPNDESFVPRAFSFSHINLTHRNWTAVGLPNVAHYPIIDPRGLLTPLFDGWSVDFWIVDGNGRPLLLPSRAKECDQRVECGDELSVETRIKAGRSSLEVRVWMEMQEGHPVCVARVVSSGEQTAGLVVALRPYNPEGISFIDTIEAIDGGSQLRVNGTDAISFSAKPRRIGMSCYKSGDVLAALREGRSGNSIQCAAGMATAAATFAVGNAVELRVRMPSSGNGAATVQSRIWRDERAGLARLEIPDPLWQRLYDTAVTTVLLHAPHEVYPGPYTYKRFWYRDAALILNALACLGAHGRARRVLDVFPRGQLADGYFRSQEGEWDSNGEVLWILDRCFRLSGESFPEEWLGMVERGARWIIGKRIPQGSRHAGLLPAGFSAEHLGLNDYYYWDDFWAVGGLRAASQLLRQTSPNTAGEFDRVADEFQQTIERSIAQSSAYQQHGAIPAAPDRRMDSGAVGSLVADFPLQLVAAGDGRTLGTVDWLLANSFVKGGFFQNMIHSGINAYLTLHVAQVLLRAGDKRAVDLVRAVAGLASPTGQWPEAIHPRTLGGCMGDGQHVWAAAEWIVMLRNLFVREEAGGLIIGSGIPVEWLGETLLRFGPAPTEFGQVTVTIIQEGDGFTATVDGRWHGDAPRIAVNVPGLAVSSSAGAAFKLARV